MMEILDPVGPFTLALPVLVRISRSSLMMLSANLVEFPPERVSQIHHA